MIYITFLNNENFLLTAKFCNTLVKSEKRIVFDEVFLDAKTYILVL